MFAVLVMKRMRSRIFGVFTLLHNKIENIGEYRNHAELMLVVSGQVGNPKVHFEAPPGNEIYDQISDFSK